jgi:hypothetical protein
MHKNLKVFFIVCFCAFVASFIIQTVFQKSLAGDMSLWGSNPGWQREIAFWNVGCAIISLLQLKYSINRTAFPALLGFTILFILLGTNHLFAILIDPMTKFHWPPFIMNYVGVFFGVKSIIEYKKGEYDEK